jgi:hypothetical protein
MNIRTGRCHKAPQQPKDQRSQQRAIARLQAREGESTPSKLFDKSGAEERESKAREPDDQEGGARDAKRSDAPWHEEQAQQPDGGHEEEDN